jgi:DNA primase
LGKILNNLFVFFDTNEKFNNKEFLKSLSKELISSFDTCFLFPLPKFLNQEKYKEEIKKVSKELLTLYVKDRIQVLSDEIRVKEKEKQAEKVEVLKEEFSKLLTLLSKN